MRLLCVRFLQLLDESSIKAYEKLCNAVLNYKSEVKYNVSLSDDVNRLFYTSFPQYVLVDGIDFLNDNSGVKLLMQMIRKRKMPS